MIVTTVLNNSVQDSLEVMGLDVLFHLVAIPPSISCCLCLKVYACDVQLLYSAVLVNCGV